MWFHGMVKISQQQTAGLDVKRSLCTLILSFRQTDKQTDV